MLPFFSGRGFISQTQAVGTGCTGHTSVHPSTAVASCIYFLSILMTLLCGPGNPVVYFPKVHYAYHGHVIKVTPVLIITWENLV